MYQSAEKNRIDYQNTPVLNAKVVQQFEQQAHRERSLLVHAFIKKIKLKRK